MIQNHMLMGKEPPEFREPKPHELMSVAETIVQSYIDGADRYELDRYLGETILPSLWKQAQERKAVPWINWDEIVYTAAHRMAAQWSPEQWGEFRARGAA